TITGTSNVITVFSGVSPTPPPTPIPGTPTPTPGTPTPTPGSATHFAVTAPESVQAGFPFSFTVTALDQFNHTAVDYAGIVHFTSTDPEATLPGNSNLTNGTGTFTATLREGFAKQNI